MTWIEGKYDLTLNKYLPKIYPNCLNQIKVEDKDDLKGTLYRGGSRISSWGGGLKIITTGSVFSRAG